MNKKKHPNQACRAQWGTHVLDEELRKVLVVIQTLLQLAHEEPDMFGRERRYVSARKNLHPQDSGSADSGPANPLSVPVVDLVDVPKDDFVLSFHVVGDAFFLDPLHEALRGSQTVKLALMLTRFSTAINQARLRNRRGKHVHSNCVDTSSFDALISYVVSIFPPPQTLCWMRATVPQLQLPGIPFVFLV